MHQGLRQAVEDAKTLRAAIREIKQVVAEIHEVHAAAILSLDSGAAPLNLADMLDVRSFIPKLEALHARYSARMTSGRKNLPSIWFDPAFVQELTDKWTPIRDELVKIDTLSDLAVRTIKVTTGTDHEGRGLVSAGQVGVILDDIKYALSIITHPMATSATPPPAAASVTVAREGIFFAGQPFDAMRAISGILATAFKSIALVDAYIGETTLDILTARPSGVTVDILTHDKPKQTTTPALKAFALAWNKQHGGGLSIRLSTAFHDRFIVIDGTDLYHLGTSIKDAAVKGGFMFSRIEEPLVLTALRDKLASEWPTYPVFV